MSAPNESIWDRERITLRQFAFIITGERDLPGGKQKFTGYALGPWVFLKRRDYGKQVLVQEGFPEHIASLIEGRVTLNLTLNLSSDRLFLKGYVRPYRIEFYEDGSGIKSAIIQDPVARSFRRSELTPVKETGLNLKTRDIFDIPITSANRTFDTALQKKS